ncbi:disulfide bond formation protein B [Novosphingobium resinovorum]|uniref:disulfide bond formation protein B n=1 Tax=Novosphingobium TaxID=165696 RepID=UPI001B3C8469|nr:MULTISPECIES: disulfide bond formation protein B [Novosphingobium]MBF7013181.1 disulfide bond formation protein B [Novosphingobium sp. HR1a]WJM27907.1 disulfide bond formation protein B [Novosphingobium resinovorum]
MAVSAAPSVRAARMLALGIPVIALGGALVSQYVFGLNPCEMCWWQRYPHMLAIVFALLAFFWRPVRPLVAVAALAVLVSGLIGGFHAGVEYKWWEGVTACTASPFAAGGDPLDAIMKEPVIRCDVAPWSLFGISLAGFNFLFSTLGALAVFALIARSDRKA